MNYIREAKIISRVKKKSKIKRIAMLLLVAVIFQFTVTEGILIYCGKSDPYVQTDFLVILGAGIYGESISLVLYERLMEGVQYLEKYPDTRVVVSGGQGQGEDITEAEAMRRFLISKGIDESRILLESRATSTMENFRFSKAIIEKESGKAVTKITFVTSSFHIARAKLLARRNGLDVYAVSCKTPNQVILKTYLREYFALFKSIFLDR